jgi:hypothetical protein
LTIRVPVVRRFGRRFDLPRITSHFQVHHSISGPGIVKAALFRSQSDYGEIVQLSFAQRIENDATCTNICVAHLVPPPWRTTELFVSNLSGSDRKRYTIITCTSAVDTNTQALHNFDALSTWKGDVLVVGHSMGQIGQLISVGDAEIDSLIAALGGIWNR